mgnify:CR=1 FL=1
MFNAHFFGFLLDILAPAVLLAAALGIFKF